MIRLGGRFAWPDAAVLGAILLLAALVRVWGVTYPPRTVLDEAWYARDGCYYWAGSAEACGMASLVVPDRDVDTWLGTFGELTPEHPPLAKWLIGVPMTVFGFVPGAWRLASLAAGVLTVAFLYLLTRRAVHSSAIAAGAAALLALDYPHVIHSRIAMLEVFVAAFAVAAFYFCVLDHAQVVRRLKGRPGHHGWRLAAGVAGGAAAASKWSGIAVVLAVLVLTAAWEWSGHRRSGRRLATLIRPGLSLLLLLVVVPLATYAATYVGRLDAPLLAAPGAGGPTWLAQWLERQAYMLSFHAAKPAAAAVPLALPMTADPLPYVLERTAAGVREILLFGNPVLWWGGFSAVVVAAIDFVRRPRRGPAGFVVMAFAASYAPWLAIAVTGGPLHLFYAVPVAPFVYLALAYLAHDVAKSRAGSWAVLAVILAALAAFAFYFPIITGQELELRQWLPRACSAQFLWLGPIDGCGLPAGTR